MDATGYAIRTMEGPTTPNKLNNQVRDQLVGWYRTQIKDNPELLDKVTPKYPPGCHRMLPADLYFSMIQKPNVTFLDASYEGEALASVDETGVTTTGGKHIDADIIIWATGFHVHKYLRGLSITGREGKDIQDLWADEEPKNWMGIMAHGFPNFFVTLGPRGLLGYQSALFSIECQAEFAIKAIKTCLENGYKTIDVSQKAQDEFIKWFDDRMANFLWNAPIKGCGWASSVGEASEVDVLIFYFLRSYYKNSKNKAVVFFPGSGSLYWWMCRKVFSDKFEFTVSSESDIT